MSSSAISSRDSGGKLFVITGPSGVGKGTLIRRLRDEVPGLDLSISATTRAPREGERDGEHYHFMDPEEFDRRVEAGEFLEHADYASHRYGTLRSEVEPRLARGESVVLEIEVQGARQVRNTMPDAVLVFIAPPSRQDLKQRLEGRGTDSPEQIAKRLEVADEELAAHDEFQEEIVNDDLDRAAGDLAALVRSALSRQA